MKDPTLLSFKIKLIATTVKSFFAVTVLLALFGAGLHNARGGTISQVPLFVSLQGVNPNVMFILDDSGSMMFEILPDDYVYWDNSHGVPYVFPRAPGVYGGSDYNNNVATVVDGDAYTALVRSSAFNKNYYSPAITYSPWKKYDGSSYPNANPACALHNPEWPGTGTDYCRNLLANLSGTANWRSCANGVCTNPGNTAIPNTNFWTATYFHHKGGDQWTWSNYSKQEIKSTTSSYSGHGRELRTDCSGGICTYAQEIQNFANWYTYYRSRILAARGGIGKAFAAQDENLRVGFGTINKGSTTVDGASTNVIVRGVRGFNGTNRQNFFSDLYTRTVSTSGTPLRRALDAAGQYFSRTSDQGPWSDTPGSTGGSAYSCRRSYTILMTDGYWTGSGGNDAATSGARNNNDGSAGSAISAPDGQTFTYSAQSPFTDTYSNTLADVAMHYWNRDLHGTLDNRVRPTDQNPAFWQHMVTFGVGLGVTGSIDPAEAFDAIGKTSPTIAWPDPQPNTQNCSGALCWARIDDLLHAAVNSRGGFFSAADPDTFANQLTQTLEEIVAREKNSSASLATNSTRREADTLIFQARFDSTDWSGELIAYQIEPDGAVGAEVWNTSSTGKIPPHGARKIFTLVGSDKVEFNWSVLTAAQKTALGAFGITQDILNWVRGDQSKEKPSGTLRQRTKLLGDIVNSDPFYVGAPPDFGYGALSGYNAFRTAKKNRTKMLYVGANDGMLHAFDATTGVEKFAFIPKAALANLASLTDPNYNHRYVVDGSPYVGDAYIGGAWKSVLIGTTGAGGRSVFALDVTDPVNAGGTVNFSSSNVLWEYSDSDLGHTIGQPTIGRLQNGTWVVVFGNGYNSDQQRAFLYVVNLQTGALVAKINTGAGSASTPNGLATPALLADDNNDFVAAYAGDLLGNLWKFDLTNNSVAFGGAPLFRARDANANIQPITAPLEIAKHPVSGYLIFFGTGKYFEVGDHNTNASPVQSLYGIWDTAVLSSSDLWQDGSAITAIDRSGLLQQTVTGVAAADGRDWRVVSKNPITWDGNTSRRGWYLDLPTAGERVVDTPILNSGRAIFTTRIPFTMADPCNPTTGTGWLMAVDMFTGGRKDDVFDVNRDGTINSADNVTVQGASVSPSGLQSKVGMPRPPTFLPAGDIIGGLLPGTGVNETYIQEFAISRGGDSGRQSWRQLR